MQESQQSEKKLDQRYERIIEEKWQKQWEIEGTTNYQENDTTKPSYSIDTPPPFTSGELHMGHVLSYSFIDFVARYKRMKGFNVYYPQGWDTQGFPTEVKVEKKFGRLPPVQFREKCIEWTREMIDKMKTQMKQMGFSADWRYEYRTMEKEYHRKIQLSLTKMYSNKLVYRGEYPVYFCTKCSSAIAKAELDDVSRTTQLNYVKFKHKKTGNTIEIATTRPELFHAVNSLIVNPNDQKNKHLIGEMAIVPITNHEVPIVADNDADMEFGSGMAMTSSYGDKADVVWTFRHKLKITHAVNERGKIINSGKYDGLSVEEGRKKVIEMLKEQDLMIKQEQAPQTVKVHDRCGHPTELLNSKQWFADIKSTGKQTKALAEQVKWIPEFGISYLVDWVDGAEWDWVISRQRVFGTPLPFYFCQKCENTKAAADSELPFYPENAKETKCDCGEKMMPETSTCDCWVDSSITPMIIAGWPDNQKMFSTLYPSSLRPQGVEIVRTWAFYTIYRTGVGMTGLPPWKEILLNGNVLATDGKKMSKSLGNVISPTDLIKDYPTDAIRQWAAMSGAMAKDRPFSYEDIKYAKSFISKIWNSAKFIETIGKYEGKEIPKLTKIDRWIIGRLNSTIKDCNEHMEKFEFHYAITKIQRFFWQDFCDNYIEYIKHRTYNQGPTTDAAKYCVNRVLMDTVHLLAPITPHLSEEIYKQLYGQIGSIHTSSYPVAGDLYEEDTATIEMFNELVKLIRQHKAKNKIAQNGELELVRLSTQSELDQELVSEMMAICKIKKVEQIRGEIGVNI